MMKVVKKAVAVPDKEQERKVPAARPLRPFEEMDRVFEGLFPRGLMFPYSWERPLLAELGLTHEGKMPRIDVIDRDAEILVRAETPGVKKDELEVAITGNTVTIKGQTSHEEKEEKGEYYRCEISRGAFSRTVSLPAEVDAEKAAAEFNDGVLEIRLPKLEHARRRVLKVA
ncbi:MAG TPA: Hsp20/alpha crystallin family protein [Burkholderiales bacterium]|nr:Hsp20/alpha crystallin family protein [Burkholderiales bacterium]